MINSNMKSTPSRFSTLNRRAEYLKLKSEKEKEKEREKAKKDEENEEEEEEEDDELEDKTKQNIQKPKNIPISKTPINSFTSLNRINDKQKITSISSTSQIPYKFSKSRLNHTQSSTNTELNTKNPKDILILRQGLHDKKSQLGGTLSAQNMISKTGQNQNFSIKQTQNSPKGLKTTSLLQNNNPQIIKATYSQSNLHSHKVSIPGNKYSSIRRFGETITKQDENKNEIKIINKNNNYTINVTNNNNTITVNNNNISNNNADNFENINEKENEININLEEKKEEDINPEEKKELNTKFKSKKEPRKDIKTNNYEFTSFKKDNDNIIKEENKEDKKINIQKEEEEEVEEEMNLTKNEKEKEKEIDSPNKKRPEYVSNEQMIKNGIEIVKFSEEETNKVYQQKAENKEKKKNKIQKKEKEKENEKEKHNNKTYYNDDNYFNNNNNKRETFIFHKRGANNFVKRGHYHYRTSHNDINEYNDDIYDHRYNNFYERGRPNPIYRGTRGRRGRYRY